MSSDSRQSAEVVELAQEQQPSDEIRGPETGSKMAWVVVAGALAISWALYAFLPFEEPARKGLALLAFVAILWLTEAIHVTITALIVPATVAMSIRQSRENRLILPRIRSETRG